MAYNSTEPSVIDEDMINKAIAEQINPDVADIVRKEGIDSNEVLSLRLDFKNILKIDNLWQCTNLTKLQLDNNIIEKIENLSHLVNLTWLDLSFNNITNIEGLDNLTKLSDLSLFSNRISKIENIDALINLQVFSIGNNNLSELDNLSYLRRFENLRVINCSGNEIAKDPNYSLYILAHLPKIKYLDYRLVGLEQVKNAREKFVDNLIAMEEEEKVLISKREAATRSKEEADRYDTAHIPRLATLFDSFFGEPEFQRYAPLARDPVTACVDDYRVKFASVVGDLATFVLKKAKEREEEIRVFTDCLNASKRDADAECLAWIENFQHSKKTNLRVIMTSHSAMDIDNALSHLKEELDTLSNNLMTAEMTIVEQFEDVIRDFEKAYAELVQSVNETVQSSFARLRDLENEFHEKINDIILTAFDRLIKSDMEDIDDEIRELLSDKDALANLVNSSHDSRISKLDHDEDTVTSGHARDLEATILGTHEREWNRNRMRVCEIVSFIEKCRSEIEAAEEGA
ncbi:outer arm dynein light chain 1 [Gonapodya prolifera JEL478]|uniref:Dynein regulatory complex subunit 3 n=1 Tax=Gonapodya prolifera (strain JEL478) TaxID=1344416 RepID=A0A139B083_GONPJ|nr:outer arm dynein light chain 1 [Gonapodya prolifera JEL478]|eukprot:KXS22377.1 outer arm dynein light chain 1 [Gonapodya prolifera JEL478]